MPGNTDYENPMGYALINKDGDFITSQNLVIDRAEATLLFQSGAQGLSGNWQGLQ